MGSEAHTRTVKVIVMKHGSKFGFRLTSKGVAQVFEACEAISIKMASPTVFISSGLGHTRQTALIAAASFAIDPQDLGEDTCFEGHRFQLDDVVMSVGALPLGGGNVADALKKSTSAQDAKDYVKKGLCWAADIALVSETDCVFIASHSPLMELAVVNPEETPYGLDEADVIVYTLECEVLEEEEKRARVSGHVTEEMMRAHHQIHDGLDEDATEDDEDGLPSLNPWRIVSSVLVKAPTLDV